VSYTNSYISFIVAEVLDENDLEREKLNTIINIEMDVINKKCNLDEYFNIKKTGNRIIKQIIPVLPYELNKKNKNKHKVNKR
jgi:hypothetical protein